MTKKNCFVDYRYFCSLLLLYLLGGLADTAANERTQIDTIVSNPINYHLKTVTLQGTATKVRPIDLSERPNYLGRRLFCSGASTFTLFDATGSIEVEYLGDCDHAESLQPMLPAVSDGDRVIIQATIQAPSSIHGSEAGSTIYGEERSYVFAVTKRITRLRQ